jgi:hypothetical protein
MNPEQQLALQNLLWSQRQQDPLFSSGLATFYPEMLVNRFDQPDVPEPQRFHPLSLFVQYANQKSSGCLQVTSGSLIWLFYLEAGTLTFATHSISPSECLDRHLMQLSQQVPSLVTAVRRYPWIIRRLPGWLTRTM